MLEWHDVSSWTDGVIVCRMFPARVLQWLLIMETESQSLWHLTPGKSSYYYSFISAAVTIDSSYVTALWSTSWGRFSPPSNVVNGHMSTMWSMVCRWPQSVNVFSVCYDMCNSVLVQTCTVFVFFFLTQFWLVSCSSDYLCLQCFDAVGWAAGRASGL